MRQLKPIMTFDSILVLAKWIGINVLGRNSRSTVTTVSYSVHVHLCSLSWEEKRQKCCSWRKRVPQKFPTPLVFDKEASLAAPQLAIGHHERGIFFFIIPPSEYKLFGSTPKSSRRATILPPQVWRPIRPPRLRCDVVPDATHQTSP
jgi:hypothetical protein